MTPPPISECLDCSQADVIKKHDTALFGDPTDVEGNPGLVGYMRDLRRDFGRMNMALWIIATVLILLLFGFNPKEIVAHILKIV